MSFGLLLFVVFVVFAEVVAEVSLESAGVVETGGEVVAVVVAVWMAMVAARQTHGELEVYTTQFSDDPIANRVVLQATREKTQREERRR